MFYKFVTILILLEKKKISFKKTKKKIWGIRTSLHLRTKIKFQWFFPLKCKITLQQFRYLHHYEESKTTSKTAQSSEFSITAPSIAAFVGEILLNLISFHHYNATIKCYILKICREYTSQYFCLTPYQQIICQAEIPYWTKFFNSDDCLLKLENMYKAPLL